MSQGAQNYYNMSDTNNKNRRSLQLADILLYGMFFLVIAIMVFFWQELRKQNEDQIPKSIMALQSNHNEKFANLTQKQVAIKQAAKYEAQLKEQVIKEIKENQGQKEAIKTPDEGIEQLRQQFIKDEAKPYNMYLFESIENWEMKQSVRPKFHREGGTGEAAPRPTTTSERRSPGTTPAQSPNRPTIPQARAPAGSLRANITAAQLDLGKRLQKLKNEAPTSETAREEKEYYEEKYKVSQYEEQPFCIVVPSFNNKAQNRYVNNINSILMQDYSNYHIVFIDDASDDETGRLMQLYARDHQISEEKLKIIINGNRTMAMPNLYRSAQEFCKPYEIYMIVDGDDELLGMQVLKHFNSLFRSKDIWVAYTNFMSIRGSIGYSRPYSQNVIERNAYRKSGFVISHLRAFYTKLFASVKVQDLQDENGNWFRAANDVAMYMPILEMTHQKVTYCPELSYLYNSNTGLNNHRVKLKEQKGNQKKVKQKASYKALDQLFTPEEKEALKASLNKKIPIKDLSLPTPASDVKKQGWEQ